MQWGQNFSSPYEIQQLVTYARLLTSITGIVPDSLPYLPFIQATLQTCPPDRRGSHGHPVPLGWPIHLVRFPARAGYGSLSVHRERKRSQHWSSPKCLMPQVTGGRTFHARAAPSPRSLGPACSRRAKTQGALRSIRTWHWHLMSF